MASRRKVYLSGIEPAYLPVLRLWALRALVRCNGVASFIEEQRFDDPMLAKMLGFTDVAISKYTVAWALRSVQRKHAAAERSQPALPTHTVMARNVSRLAAAFGLDAVEQDILHLCVLEQTQSELHSALGSVGELSAQTLCRVLSECLGHPLASIRNALDFRSKLTRSALLSIDRSSRYPFSQKIDLLDGLADDLMQEHDDLLSLFSGSVVQSAEPHLTLDSYPHLDEDIRILRGYLDAASRLGQPGVNVLVYGPPGTGKTEFVRAMVRDAGLKLLEIPTERRSGKPRTGQDRFESFRCAQNLLKGGDLQVLLFDEVEDVFCAENASGCKAGDGNASGMKGWVNQALERNPVPTFWVTNHLNSIDAAYRRRFDYVLHIDMPPASVRRRVIDSHTRDFALSQRWRDSAASHAELAPAVVERAAKVGTLVCDVLPDIAPEMVLTRIMNNTLACLGEARLPDGDSHLVTDYRLDLLNADCDLGRLREGLRRVGEGRICLYGPPGTGKTAFGRHVAASLARPLLVKRASDILSPYVGMAERNIARMFAEATLDGAVLLLDEADSLLQDRRGAYRSWEVTQVNEMLTQMESFHGIFIASTNLMESLDPAAMRRFDQRIHMSYLQPEQAWSMFDALARRIGLDPEPIGLSALNSLLQLTPGDFAAAARQARLDAPTDARELVDRLRRMCEGKREARHRPIGFTA